MYVLYAIALGIITAYSTSHRPRSEKEDEGRRTSIDARREGRTEYCEPSTAHEALKEEYRVRQPSTERAALEEESEGRRTSIDARREIRTDYCEPSTAHEALKEEYRVRSERAAREERDRRPTTGNKPRASTRQNL